jgi:hypothetical protein
MPDLANFPAVLLLLTAGVLWLAEQLGIRLRRKRGALVPEEHEDLNVVVSATLTLLALIIGFSFSMAVGRFDARKNYEEQEANAIGTEYVRAGLLPAADAARTHSLLKAYLDERILWYTTRYQRDLAPINDTTAKLQNELWAIVQSDAAAHPTPIVGLAVSGMNDVLNSQGYTQAAWLNRIPLAAWILLAIIAAFANVLVGYNSQRFERPEARFLVMPLLVAFAFFLIADMDSPRGGTLRIPPQNLLILAHSLPGA